jgi:hypothetical protein
VTPRLVASPEQNHTRRCESVRLYNLWKSGPLRYTVRPILTALRAVLSAAVEDKLIDGNPASKVDKFNNRERGQNKAQAMTQEEAHAFLNVCVEVCPDYYTLFFTALRSGLRKSELIALKWGDTQFGESDDDKDHFILVQRHYYMEHFGISKTHGCRPVDPEQLRQVLMAQKKMLCSEAFNSSRGVLLMNCISFRGT